MRMTCRAVLVVLFVGCGRLLAAAEDGPERQTLFRTGEGGYASYRIPSVIVTARGVVLAFCEGRKASARDWGEIHLLARRSTDGGRTFAAASVVWADGANTCGNPCAVVDEGTGDVWLLMTHNLGADREGDIVAGRAKGARTVWVTRSRDDGATWERPREITEQVKRPVWAWYATGPGIGIQLTRGAHKGRLVVPCDHIDRGGGTDAGNSHVIYSDDHGDTWHVGGEPPERRFNESQVVELDDGSVMLNMRNTRPGAKQELPVRRGVAVSADGGESFAHASWDAALIEPICQGSILRYAWPDGERPGLILFSNPASARRERMTVRLSRDDGRTWSASRVVWDGPAAYSCLVRLPGGDVGLLYEAGEKTPTDRIELARFPVGWLSE